jgi:hypothetical protein
VVASVHELADPLRARRLWWERLLGLRDGMPQQIALDRIARAAAMALLLSVVALVLVSVLSWQVR